MQSGQSQISGTPQLIFIHYTAHISQSLEHGREKAEVEKLFVK